MVTKEDMNESVAILRALEHASQVNAAELEGLKLNTATKESVERLDAKFDIMNNRLLNQEVDLQLLKRVKWKDSWTMSELRKI